ncbi:hypothetical protein EON65_38805 [archaeon]|nr:MAG: hypothetical protein EON65_38805 [archaeon]
MTKHIYVNVRTSIRNFEDAILKVPEGMSVSRRAFSYQALMAHLFNKNKGTMELDIPLPTYMY